MYFVFWMINFFLNNTVINLTFKNRKFKQNQKFFVIKINLLHTNKTFFKYKNYSSFIYNKLLCSNQTKRAKPNQTLTPVCLEYSLFVTSRV